MPRPILDQVEDTVTRLWKVYFVQVLGGDEKLLQGPDQVADDLLQQLREEEHRPPARERQTFKFRPAA